MDLIGIKAIAAASGVAVAGSCIAFAQAWVATKAIEAMSRNPSESGQLFSKTITAMALIEACAIYSLLIALIIIFVM